jgi:DNA-binding NarL/FixJ family response regulator
MIRVILAEDHATVREALRLLIQAETDMEVVAEVADGRRVVDCAAQARPDVAVLDLSMPGAGGLQAARALRQSHPDVAIVALTRHREAAFVSEFMEIGASAYVLKQSSSAELLRAIRAAAVGERYFDPALPSDENRALETRRPGTPRATERELQVLRRLALGYSNKEISAALGISVKTVEVHKANVMRKLGLNGRTDIVRYAVVVGWLADS